jgi:hypothetical protein
MTHKEECICYCIDHLNSRSISGAFNFKTFEYYYRKFNGSCGNAYLVGINAADIMIENFKSNKQEVNHETGNER